MQQKSYGKGKPTVERKIENVLKKFERQPGTQGFTNLVNVTNENGYARKVGTYNLQM